jgi:hypothetical protein
VAQAAVLLATVVGQDLDQDAEGVFRIARKVAKDRVISTVDPEARHGHKTSARGFDGYKGHLAADPDSEIVTATQVTAGNTGDADAAVGLLADLLADSDESGPANTDSAHRPDAAPPAAAYGDAAYGKGEVLEELHAAGIEVKIKVQPPVNSGDRFTKDAFDIDLAGQRVTCPNGVTALIERDARGDGTARFAIACASCPLAARCTTAAGGRTVTVSRHEEHLARARTNSCDPTWRADYRATRPKIERKIAHLMRRRHGGRRARMRGREKIASDFALLAAAVNIARLGVLGIMSTGSGNWAVTAG